MPEDEPADTMAVYPGLLQMPPVIVSFNVVVVDGHAVRTPVIEDGSGFTVSDFEAAQPVDKR